MIGVQTYSSNVADVLPKLFEEKAKNSTGAIVFTRKDENQGRIFFRNGLVYGADSTTCHPSIVYRIAYHPSVSEENRKKILGVYGSAPKEYRVLDYVTVKSLIPQRLIMVFLKEYFLDTVAEMFTWQNVEAVWRENEEPVLPTIPNTMPSDLLDKVQKYHTLLLKLSEVWETTPDGLYHLSFYANPDVKDVNEDSLNSNNEVSVFNKSKEGSHTVMEAIDSLGLSIAVFFKSLYNLWVSNYVVIESGGKKIYFSPQTTAHKSSSLGEDGKTVNDLTVSPPPINDSTVTVGEDGLITGTRRKIWQEQLRKDVANIEKGN